MIAPANAHDPVGYYEQDAEAFVRRYDSVAFESVHRGLAHHLPATGANVLDVGAGSGRDARALAARGYRVTAVEPAGKFRRHGRTKGPSEIIWLDDRLPHLNSLIDHVGNYAFILCSAVLMLIPHEALGASLTTMRRLLATSGKLAVSVRDPVAGEPTTLFHMHTDAAILEAALAAGLSLVEQSVVPDTLRRDPHRWRTFVFERAADRAQ